MFFLYVVITEEESYFYYIYIIQLNKIIYKTLYLLLYFCQKRGPSQVFEIRAIEKSLSLHLLVADT